MSIGFTQILSNLLNYTNQISIVMERGVIVIGQKILLLREQNNMTQEQLAKLVNLSQQTIDHYEKGRAKPNIDTVSLFASVFTVSTDYLIGRTNAPRPTDARQHVNDDDALEYLDELHKRPEMKTLFQVGRKATKEDIETAITVIEALKKKGGGEDD